jgi:hypothetical protein
MNLLKRALTKALVVQDAICFAMGWDSAMGHGLDKLLAMYKEKDAELIDMTLYAIRLEEELQDRRQGEEIH